MFQQQWQQYLAHAGDAEDAPAGLAYVPDLAAVVFQGANAREFLQGYLTSDTSRLEPGTLVPTALCSLKGRVVMNGWCAPAGEHDVLLVLHAALVETLARFLKPYLMFSRHTELVDRRDDTVIVASLDRPQAAGGLALDARRSLFVIADLDQGPALWERHPHTSARRWHAALTADGIPLVSPAVSETFLPQMLNLDVLRAIDFEKGCYLGQEVVARAQHRGQVKRRLARLEWVGPAAPPAGEDVTDENGRVQGAVVQSAADGDGSGPLLAVLREQAPDVLRQGDVHLKRLT